MSASLAPVPPENATCSNCGAPLVADQRYCLSCGQPVSPVRLAFLDVLENERQPQLVSPPFGGAAVPYQPYQDPAAGPAWLRRYAPLMSVLSVLLLAMVVGLLVGHWVTQKNNPASTGPQIVKIEGLGALASGAAASTTSTTATTPASTSGSTSSSKSEEEKEAAEAKAEEKAEEKTPAKAQKAKALGSATQKKLESTHGKAYAEEVNKLTTEPVEVK